MRTIDTIKQIFSIKEISNFAWLSGDKLVKLILGLIVGIWVARYLEPINFGILTFWLTLLGFFEVFASFGTQNVVIKKLVEENNKDQILIGAIALRLILSFFAAIAFGITSLFFNSMDIENIQLFLIFILFFRFSEIFKYFFESVVQSKYAAWSESIALTISGCIKIILILLSENLDLFIIVAVFEASMILILMVYFAKKNFPETKFLNFKKFRLKQTYHLMKESVPFFLASLTVLLYMKIDQIMVGVFLDPIELGYYAVAVKITEVWYFVPLALISSFFPMLIKSFLETDAFKKLISNLFFSLFWISMLASVLTLLLSEKVIILLFGTPYLPSAGLLNLYIFSGVLVGLSTLSDRWYQLNNLSDFIFYKSLCGALTNIVLNYFLIKLFGVWGAAISTVLTLFILVYIFDLFSKKTRPLLLLKVNSLLRFYDFKKIS
ncbi:MAG: flippase [SAR86 cluster bacterium]|nr:flippase [SAR86 cluster bacterium]